MDDFKKNGAFPEGNKPFWRRFCANLNEAKADMAQSTKRWN